jgi:hypothetical protein
MPTKSNFRLTLQSFGAREVPAVGSAATGVTVVAGAVVAAAAAGLLVAVPVVVPAAVGLSVAAGAAVGGAVAGLLVLAGLLVALELPFFCSLRDTPPSRSAAACSAKGQPARAWQATRLSTKVTAQAFMLLGAQEE